MASLCSILQIYNDSLIYKCDKWTFTACKTVLTMYIVKTKRVQLNIQLKLKHEQNMYKNGSVQSQTYSHSAETNESKYSIRLYSTNNVKQINDYNNGANFSEIISAQFCIFHFVYILLSKEDTIDSVYYSSARDWRHVCGQSQVYMIKTGVQLRPKSSDWKYFFPLEYIRDFNVWSISKFIKVLYNAVKQAVRPVLGPPQ